MEYVDVVDQHDTIVGQELKTTCHAQGFLHRGAGVLLFRDTTYRDILLQRRSFRVSNAGLWCTPGGHVMSGEDYATAVQRECREEVFSCRPDAPALSFEHLYTFLKDDPADREFIAVFRSVCAGPFHPDLTEVSELCFVPLEQLRVTAYQHPELYTHAFHHIFGKYLEYTSG